MSQREVSGTNGAAATAKRVYILSNGCHESFIDAAVLETYFGDRDDMVMVHDVADADLIVLLGCCGIQLKEDQTRELISAIEQQKRPDAELLVAGCIAKVRSELADQNVDSLALARPIDDLLTLRGESECNTAHFPYRPYRDQEDFVMKVKLRRREKQLRESVSSSKGVTGFLASTFGASMTRMLSRYEAFIHKRLDVWNEGTYTTKISTGCCGACSYCCIKQSRGPIRSRPIEEIVEGFQEGRAQGYTDFALIGTDIGDYGKDRGENLLDLLQVLVSQEGAFTIRLRNVNPRWLIPSTTQLCELLATGKISYIQSPIQSCSERVLQRMNRGYRAADFFDAIRTIRGVSPQVFLKTQLIAGFPGETEEDFLENKKVYTSKLFNYVDVFPYSDRPNTLAVALPDHLPPEVIMARCRRLLVRSMFGLAPKQLLRQWLSPSTG